MVLLMAQAAPGAPALNEAVAQLCCAAWTKKAECREALVAQTLPYLLLRALTSGWRHPFQASNTHVSLISIPTTSCV